MPERIVTSHSNPAVKRLRSLARAHTRRKSDTFLIEGPKFILDAVGAGIEFLTLVVSESFKGRIPQTGPNTRLLRVSGHLYREISDTSSPQGLIGEAKRRWAKLTELTGTGRHLLVAWDVQDPGNVGTMIRSCAAFEMGGVITGRRSADPFCPKAVRASAGAVLRHPVCHATQLGKLTEALHGAGYSTYWTGAHAELLLGEVAQESRLAVFVGSEGRGFAPQDRTAIGRGIRVPIASGVESLNAGMTGSIVAYELRRQSE